VAGERILVVDDEPGVRGALEHILADEGFEVVAVGSGEDGLAAAERQPFDAWLLDVWLPGIDGLETLRRLRELRTDAEVVMISGHGTIDTAVQATKLGAFDFVEKPLSLEKTLLVLRNALRQRRLEQRNRRLLEHLERDTEIVGKSAAAALLRREVEIAAGTDAPVLILGEPGSGRETVARRIHAAGRDPDAPFVTVSAATVGAQGAEAVLFGAAADGGRLALAEGGTLFVEDGELLDRASQLRLADWLASRARGEGAPRVILAAGPSPAALAPELLAAVDVVRIRVPPLRERREDIPPLVERQMQRLAKEYGRPAKALDATALAALAAYGWPGNVQELNNLVERLLLLAPGEAIVARDLPEALGGVRPPAEDLYRDFDSLADGLAAFERYFVARTLAECDADPEAAAHRLRISRRELDEKLSGG
jgi:two-component system nitrogen regulation response regulator NtrX